MAMLLPSPTLHNNASFSRAPNASTTGLDRGFANRRARLCASSPGVLLKQKFGSKHPPTAWRRQTVDKRQKDWTMAENGGLDSISHVAQSYYDSDDAFNFYKQVWGGEFIHVGLYDAPDADVDAPLDDQIKAAAKRSVENLFAKSGLALGPGMRVMDMGSAYGGAARYAARTFGCSVVCIDISKKENEVNRDETAAAGLGELVIIPGERSFFETQEPHSTFDLVVSQDSLLHAGADRHRAVTEAARVLKPGGFMVFTDIMQSDNADPSQLEAVYKRIHLDDMGCPASYRRCAESSGLRFVEFEDRTSNLAVHYGSVCRALKEKRAAGLLDGISGDYIDNMVRGLDAWVAAAAKDNLCWGYVVLQKPPAAAAP